MSRNFAAEAHVHCNFPGIRIVLGRRPIAGEMLDDVDLFYRGGDDEVDLRQGLLRRALFCWENIGCIVLYRRR